MASARKICYIIDSLSNGGAERQLYETVRLIDREEFQPMVVSLSDTGNYWSHEIRKLGVKVVEFSRTSDVKFARLMRIIDILKAVKPDIVHTYLFLANAYGRTAATITRTPVVIAAERSLGVYKSKRQILIDKTLSYFSDRIVSNSPKTTEFLQERQRINPEKLLTIHNGVNVDLYNRNYRQCDLRSLRDSLGIGAYDKVVATVGRLCIEKNHKLFLDMAALLAKSRQGTKFLVVGGGVLKDDLLAYAKKLGVDESAVFTGERSDVPRILKLLDVFVLTSDYEGMPNAVMEAMASSLPCVVTDVGGNSELVIDGETGFVVEPNNPQEIAEKVLYLLNNQPIAREMGLRGYRRVKEHFSLDAMISQTQNLYKSLLEP